MKFIKIQYQCNYCKQMIDPDNDTVMSLVVGRIGYKDNFLPDTDPKPEDQYHYHDYCLKHLLTLEFKESEKETEKDQSGIDWEKYYRLKEAGERPLNIAKELGTSLRELSHMLKERGE